MFSRSNSGIPHGKHPTAKLKTNGPQECEEEISQPQNRHKKSCSMPTRCRGSLPAKSTFWQIEPRVADATQRYHRFIREMLERKLETREGETFRTGRKFKRPQTLVSADHDVLGPCEYRSWEMGLQL